ALPIYVLQRWRLDRRPGAAAHARCRLEHRRGLAHRRGDAAARGVGAMSRCAQQENGSATLDAVPARRLVLGSESTLAGPSIGVSRGDGLIGGAGVGCSQRGYSLLEVIVAFAVLGVALSLLLGALSGGTRQVRWAADSGRAVLHAQSLLDEVGVGEVLAPGRRDGEFAGGRYRWVLDVAPYVDPDRPPVPQSDPYAP